MTGPRTSIRAGARAFSLIELLLSVFILAIGIISVSALFPAGIAQQQASADDQLGPVVAEQALGLLRSRVSPQDFGTFEEFGITNVLQQSTAAGSYVFRPSAGDWSWIRPGVIRQQQQGVTVNLVGAIDIFSTLAQNMGNSTQEFCEFPTGVTGGGVRLFGAPYSTARTSLAPPIIVTQRERWWPTVPEGAAIGTPPQYAWDCMFRRQGNHVQVAIFVFRVIGVGGAAKTYTAAVTGQPALPASVTNGNYPDLPPVPYRRVLVRPGTDGATGTTGTRIGNQLQTGWAQPSVLSLTQQSPFATGMVTTTQGISATDFSANAVPLVTQHWQLPGQWLVDNNGNVHRIAVGRRNVGDAVLVRLSAPVPRVPATQAFDDYELQPTGATDPVPQGVRTIHYVPSIIDANGTQLVPVYATVRDL